MLDPITLDQLRTLVAVVDAGSFSAAGRRLQRVQSAVSTAMANLEAQLGVAIWDRSTKVPTLTPQGRAIAAAARRVGGEVDALRRLGAELAGGLEASVSLCVDQLFPIAALVALCEGLGRRFPAVDLRVDSGTMSDVSARVLAGQATLGVVSPLGLRPGLEPRALASIQMIPVAAAGHPLAAARRALPAAALAAHVQIVLSERGDTSVPDQAVLSPRTWRVADLHTKHALLRAGLGWGNLPAHTAADDLRRGRLVRLRPEAWGEDEHTLRLYAVHRPDAIFGPAHAWLLEQLPQVCSAAAAARVGGRRRRRALTKAA